MRSYIESAVYELLHKVSWPTWKELQTSAVIVLVSSIILALIIWLMDFIFGIREGSFWSGILGYFYSNIG